MKLLDRLRGIKDKAAESAGQHSDKVKDGIEKTGDFVDRKTGGKHADKIEQAEQKAKDATDSLAEKKDERRDER